jgi:hypothetical protein
VIDTSVTITINTTATSSHEFSWEVDTLGIFPSIFRDVAVIDENNVWAVGEIRLDEPDTVFNNPFRLTNAVKWNGSANEYYYLPVKNFAGDDGFQELMAIIAFSQDNIWMFSGAGSYVHWDGFEWTSEFMWEQKGTLQAAWGASAADFYAVGENGTLVHYDGTEFTAVESGTDIDLFDIKGVVDKNTGQQRIWALGDGIVIYYDGETWQQIWDAADPIFPDHFAYPRAVCVPDNKTVILSVWNGNHSRLYAFDQLNFNNNVLLIDQTNYAYGMYCDGNDDIFINGSFTSIEHYDGNSNKFYTEISGSGRYYSMVKYKSKVYAVGKVSEQLAIFLHGTQ